jgi:hypothetical protein
MKEVLLFLLLVPSVAFGAPFLVCDVPPVNQNVTSYEIFQDGVSVGVVAAETDGSLKYDLGSTAPGNYTWTATAINEWGASTLSNPYVSPPGATAPLNLRLIP